MDLLAATFYLHLDFKILFNGVLWGEYLFFVQTIKLYFSGALEWKYFQFHGHPKNETYFDINCNLANTFCSEITFSFHSPLVFTKFQLGVPSPGYSQGTSAKALTELSMELKSIFRLDYK